MIKDSMARIIVKVILVLCLPLLLLLSNVHLLLTPGFIRYEYSKPHFPDAILYNDTERLSLAEATLHYLRSNEQVDYLATLQTRGRAVYNTREIKHLVDVKTVMNTALWLHKICVLLCLLAIAFSWQDSEARRNALLAIYQGCFAFLILLVTIGVLAYTKFDVFFTYFHRLFFEGNSWLFAFSDTLIQLFPLQFWVDATWILVLLTVVEYIVVGVTAYALYRTRRFQR